MSDEQQQIPDTSAAEATTVGRYQNTKDVPGRGDYVTFTVGSKVGAGLVDGTAGAPEEGLKKPMLKIVYMLRDENGLRPATIWKPPEQCRKVTK